MIYDVTIQLESPLHLGSGGGNVNLDAEVIHDRYGLPYFPAKRFKGLLYESLLEISEMSGLDLAEEKKIKDLFHHSIETEERIRCSDFRLPDYEDLVKDLKYLEERYPDVIRREDVLERFTSFRFQTAIEHETGVARDTSLHNLRVVDAGLKLEGWVEICPDSEELAELLALGLSNLRFAGGKRNRGFGKIRCEMKDGNRLLEKALEGGRSE